MPAEAGGVYKPVVVIVPVTAEPPDTPSTDQVTPLPLAENCCVRIGVNVAVPGVIVKAAGVVALATFEYALRFPAASVARTR